MLCCVCFILFGLYTSNFLSFTIVKLVYFPDYQIENFLFKILKKPYNYGQQLCYKKYYFQKDCI